MIGGEETNVPAVILGNRDWRERYLTRSILGNLVERGRSLLYFTNENDEIYPEIVKRLTEKGYEYKELWIPAVVGAICVDPIRYVGTEDDAFIIAKDLIYQRGDDGTEDNAECEALYACILYMLNNFRARERTMQTLKGLLSMRPVDIEGIIRAGSGRQIKPDIAIGEDKTNLFQNIYEDINSYIPFIGNGSGEIMDFSLLKERPMVCQIHTYTPMTAADKMASTFLTIAMLGLSSSFGRSVDVILEADGRMTWKKGISRMFMESYKNGIQFCIHGEDIRKINESYPQSAVAALRTMGDFTIQDAQRIIV